MFAKIFTASSFVLALTVQVYGHAAVAPALGVNGGTPDRGDVKAPSNNNPCGNNIDIAATIDSSESVPIKDGSITVSSINFNGGGDGSRQVSAKLDATGKGDAFDTDLTVTKNGDPAPNQEKGEDSVVVTIPADTKCTGGQDGNKCLVQFKTTAGFGNCVVVQQDAAAAAGNADAGNANANAGGNANAGAGENANAGAGGNTDTGAANADTGADTGANDPAGAANSGANGAENAGADAGADTKSKGTATAAGATADNTTATGANADTNTGTGAAADANAASANEPATGNAGTNSTETGTPDGNANANNANADPPAAAGDNGGAVDASTAVGGAAGAAAGAGAANAAANNGGNGKKKAKKNTKNRKGGRPAGTRAARAVLAGIDIRNYEEPEVLRRSWTWAKDSN